MTSFGLIVPLRNAARHLPSVLGHLDLGPDWEVVLVDDGSTDGSYELARSLLPNASILRNERSVGPAEARNLGVEACAADIIVFLDSDVVASTSTIKQMAKFLESRADLAATFGAYDDRPAVPASVSRFRNLLHHYVHARCEGVVPSFWSGFGAVRREVFLAVGGFDARRYPSPSVEDIDFGARLAAAGFHVYLEPGFQATHLKHWTLGGFVRTDIFHRSRPWVLMMLEGRAPKTPLNMGNRFKMPILLFGLFLATLLASLLCGSFAAVPALVGLLYLSLNGPVYRFMSSKGVGLASVPLLAIHHFCALLGAVLAVHDVMRSD